jgi:hypothetical protein
MRSTAARSLASLNATMIKLAGLRRDTIFREYCRLGGSGNCHSDRSWRMKAAVISCVWAVFWRITGPNLNDL